MSKKVQIEIDDKTSMDIDIAVVKFRRNHGHENLTKSEAVSRIVSQLGEEKIEKLLGDSFE